MLWYRRINIFFFAGTLLAHTTPSTRQNKYYQLYVCDKWFVMIKPMKLQSEFNNTLLFFCKEIGATFPLEMDVHMDQKNNRTKKLCYQVGTNILILVAGNPWANCAEIYISIFKEAVHRDLHMTNASMVFWDYWMERWTWINNTVPCPFFQNQAMTPHEATFGKQGSISNIYNFGWYQWVY